MSDGQPTLHAIIARKPSCTASTARVFADVAAVTEDATLAVDKLMYEKSIRNGHFWVSWSAATGLCRSWIYDASCQVRWLLAFGQTHTPYRAKAIALLQ